MTRRKFIKKLITAASVVVGGAGVLAKKADPRRFVRAVRTKFYPGSLKPLRDVTRQGKWSG